MRIKSIFDQSQHCILRSHLSPAEAGASKIGCLCSSEEAQAVVSNCCNIRQGNHFGSLCLLMVLYSSGSGGWRSKDWPTGTGKPKFLHRARLYCMGDIKKPLLPPQCMADSGTLRQGALCSPLNFFTKSQRRLSLSGFSQFTSLKYCLHLNLY